MNITNSNGNFVIDEKGIRINGMNFYIAPGNIDDSEEDKSVAFTTYVSDTIDETVGSALGAITTKDDDGNVFVKADKLSGIINACG